MSDMEPWLRERRVTEVECLVADLNGIARGKILPSDKFVRSSREDTLRLPEMIFVQTVTGDYPDEDRVTDPAGRDVRMRPDPRSLRIVPWYDEPTAQVICDCRHHDDSEVTIAPRQVLRGNMLEAVGEVKQRAELRIEPLALGVLRARLADLSLGHQSLRLVVREDGRRTPVLGEGDGREARDGRGRRQHGGVE